ncbi:hypothetical protein [Geodermatophilus marinus]|uniref:hypothetical protein n=1 Tax=Geodermatophilus sp. LHW52908 TaxID=2303986 RepID=UPI000E3C62A4|nr:hypothetical protein [Geodermatophilus sp. LHW52908]RFU19691.1 hypothetical protein D0Z06_20175 [Geodermatophilus sp. LHW52908]
MRVSFVVYGLLYVLVELVGYRLEQVGWPRLTALDVAAAITDACLAVAVVSAVLVAGDVGLRRRRARRDGCPVAVDDGVQVPDAPGSGPITVRSWRPRPALPAGHSAYAVPDVPEAAYPTGSRPFPAHPGRLL